MSIPLIVNEPPPLNDDDDVEESGRDGYVDEFHPSGLNLDLNDSPADSPRKIPLSSSSPLATEDRDGSGSGAEVIESKDQAHAVNGDRDFKTASSTSSGSVTSSPSPTIKGENENENQEDIDNVMKKPSDQSVVTSPVQDPSPSSHNPSSNNISTNELSHTETEPSLENHPRFNSETISNSDSEISGVNYSQLPLEQVSVDKVEDNENIENIENDDDFAEFESFQEFNNSSGVISSVQENEDNKVIQKLDVEDEFGDFSSELPSVVTPNNTTIIDNDEKVVGCQAEFLDDDDDDDDFDDFQSNSTVVNETLPPQVSLASNNNTNQQTNQLKSSELVSQSQFVSDDNYQYKSTTSTNINNSAPVENKLNYESLIKSVFVKVDESVAANETDENSEGEQQEGKTLVSIDKILEDDKEWLQIKDFESSQSLLFKWINCISYQEYIKSLKVDLNNGNIDVPKFAANLQQCRSPLQPKISIIPLTPTKPTDNPTPTGTTSLDDGDAIKAKEILEPPSALSCDKFKGQYSSSSEYSSNPNTSTTPIGERGQFPLPEGADEVQWILNQIPDLSFMRSKTLLLPN